MEVRSQAFKDRETIPGRYTCRGENISPPLEWTPVEGVKSYAVVCDDPDAVGKIWDHWILYNIPADTTSLPEGIGAEEKPENNSLHGTNTWGRKNYGGPCPPEGSGEHRYFFTVYALSIMLENRGLTKEELLYRAKGHIIASASIIGLCGAS